MQGRKPTPSHMKAYLGPHKMQDAAPVTIAPECPDWLDDEARAEWSRVVPELERWYKLDTTDIPTLATYCQTFSDWKRATLQLRAEGQTFANRHGEIVLHPLARLSATLLAELRRQADLLGLSPQARARLSFMKKTPEDDDEFADFQMGAE